MAANPFFVLIVVKAFPDILSFAALHSFLQTSIFLSVLTFLYQEKQATAVVSPSALSYSHILAMAL